MAASSSSTAAADSRPPKYDVFISFRGEDTRKGFASHLYSALSGKQIEAYIDEVSLEKGDTISRALPEAIKESEISIIIFSENYGESRWCLDELVHILKRREEKDQIVLPIFYNIDPSHIRHQKETYAVAFVKHEECFKDEMEKVREWRRALKEAADLSGWDSQGKSESEIIKEVVERVRTELDIIMSKRSDDFQGLVGIPERLEIIKSYLDSPAVRVVVIWGMGGIGKTTLAEVVYNRFCNDFDGSCFAPNVRENALNNKGLDTLKAEVFSKLLREKVDIFQSSAINHKLSRKRILLVLDDVEDPMQFEHLVGKSYRFCPGSKIIVTSRDNKLIVDKEYEEYKVEALGLSDARKLFYLKAFGDESGRRGLEKISDRVVKYTKGHPLALEVLGASVFRNLQSIEDWEKEMKKLKRIPNDQIRKVLERSYDALDDEQKGLFLDIACFFKGQQRDFVEGILEDKPIAGLVHKSLITIEDDKIQMHDLIQEMGRNIVLRSTEKLGERSRLWIADDVYYTLENNKGTGAIEGIYLPPWIFNKRLPRLPPDVFEEMCKLRLLRLPRNVYIDGDLKYLPDGLRYLHWEWYPGKSLPSNFKPDKLVELHMPTSKLKQLWDGVRKLGSLKHINLEGSQHLTKIPDLSLAPKLESINLSSCDSLTTLPKISGNITKLVLKRSAVKELPSSIQSLENLLVLDLESCSNLKSLPKLPRNIEVLRLDYSGIEQTPSSSIESLENITKLDLVFCYNLKSLPKLPRNIEVLRLDYSGIEQIPSSSIDSLENLHLLNLEYCYNLKSLPKLPRNIEVLRLDNSGIEQIPSSSIECLCSLRILSLRQCKRFSSLPSNINLKALEELDLEGTSIQELPSTIENSIGLRRLCLSVCNHLEFIPKTLCKLTRLKELSFHGCSKLGSLPMWTGLCSLTLLFLSDCNNIREIPDSLESLTSLTLLNLGGNIFDGIPASIGMLCKLERLYMGNCKNLQSLPASIGMLYNLKKLDIKKCQNLESLPELPLFIESVNAEDCSSLEMVSTLRSTLTLGRWLDKYDSYFRTREFSFVNCTQLGEDAINNIFTEFLYKVFCTATTPPEVVVSKRVIGELVVCYPTKEIPRWFNNQSEGSSITITLPPNWYNPKTFLGFVVFAVVAEAEAEAEAKAKADFVEDEDEDEDDYVEDEDEADFVEDEDEDDFAEVEDLSVRVECKLRLMTNKDRFRVAVFDYKVTSCLDHIVMWYKYFDHSKANFEKYQEASLEFKSYNGRVKRCGVRMLYLKDAVEEFDDGLTANFKSWITDVTDSGTSDEDFQSCGSDDDYLSCGSDVIDSDYATTYDSST